MEAMEAKGRMSGPDLLVDAKIEALVCLVTFFFLVSRFFTASAAHWCLRIFI